MSMRAFAKLPTAFACLVIFALALAATGAVAHAQEAGSSGEPVQATGYDEAEAISIDRMLMCPVCPAETIDQAQVEVSRQMRLIVREMLSQGSSRDEILDFFVGNYGADILAAPPKSGFNLLAWIVPAAAIVAVLAVGFLVIRSMTGRGVQPATAVSGAEEDLAPYDLAPYLEAVDRDLGLDLGLLASPGGSNPTARADRAEIPPPEEGLSKDV
jgi:cytochrome c-type biogenesis protein CcmH/NrfF